MERKNRVKERLRGGYLSSFMPHRVNNLAVLHLKRPSCGNFFFDSSRHITQPTFALLIFKAARRSLTWPKSNSPHLCVPVSHRTKPTPGLAIVFFPKNRALQAGFEWKSSHRDLTIETKVGEISDTDWLSPSRCPILKEFRSR